jgi:hypothetical protein
MSLPQPFSTTLPQISSFNFQDLVDGQGITIFYPCVCYNGSQKDFVLSSTAMPSNTLTGLMTTGTSFFETKNYIKPLTIKGDAFLSGYADYNSSNISFTAQLYAVTGGETATLGASVDSDATEYTSTTNPYVLKKTFTTNNFIYKLTAEGKRTGNYGNGRYTFYYEGGQTAVVNTADFNLTNYLTYEVLNPYPTKYVLKIECGLWSNDDTGDWYFKNHNVYASTLSNYAETAISSSITSETYSADQPFLLKIPLTQTDIKIDDRIQLRITQTAANGGIVIDPTNSVIAKPTLKLNIPFNIDL